MHFARNTSGLATAVVVALTLASNAVGQETALEVIDETNGGHCNPCEIDIVGVSSFAAHPGGVEISLGGCADTLDAEIYEDFSGHVTDISMVGAQCHAAPCPNGSSGYEEWPFIGGEVSSRHEHAIVDICFLGGQGQPLHCEVEFEIFGGGPADHHYLISTSDFSCGGNEVSMSWEVDDEIEVTHS